MKTNEMMERLIIICDQLLMINRKVIRGLPHSEAETNGMCAETR